MVNLSILTHSRSVSERLPYPIITDLDSNAADHPFQVLSPKLSYITLLPLGTAINRVPLIMFPLQGGSRGSKGFPEQQGMLQPSSK